MCVQLDGTLQTISAHVKADDDPVVSVAPRGCAGAGRLPRCLGRWPTVCAGREVGPVCSLLVLLALRDRRGHGSLALVDVADAHPLPVDRLLPQGHLQAEGGTHWRRHPALLARVSRRGAHPTSSESTAPRQGLN